MRYVCLVYFDPNEAFGKSPAAEAVMRDVTPFKERLKASGHYVSDEALQFPKQAMTVRVREGKVSATDGPFIETKEMLGGIVLLEARDMNEAIRLASEIPHARLGSVEVRPVVDFSQPRPQL